MSNDPCFIFPIHCHPAVHYQFFQPSIIHSSDHSPTMPYGKHCPQSINCGPRFPPTSIQLPRGHIPGTIATLVSTTSPYGSSISFFPLCYLSLTDFNLDLLHSTWP